MPQHSLYLRDPQLWDLAQAKAQEDGLPLSQVVAILLAAYVAGELQVTREETVTVGGTSGRGNGGGLDNA